MAIPLRVKLTKIVTIENNAALVNVVIGVTKLSEKVTCDASADKTMRQNASAPPKTPNLQAISAIGTIINDIPNSTIASLKLGSRNILTNHAITTFFTNSFILKIK